MEKIYYMSKLHYEIKVNGDTIPGRIEQLVLASNKGKAKEAIISALNKEWPGAIVIMCRIDDTIIGE